MATFQQMIEARREKGERLGLVFAPDPDGQRFPRVLPEQHLRLRGDQAGAVAAASFVRSVLLTTQNKIACAVVDDTSFVRYGAIGVEHLEGAMAQLRTRGVPSILDTGRVLTWRNAQVMFRASRADAITIVPNRTENEVTIAALAAIRAFAFMQIQPSDVITASRVAGWNQEHGSVGLAVGHIDTEALQVIVPVVKHTATMLLLTIGEDEGNTLEEVVNVLQKSDCLKQTIVCVGSAVLYPADGTAPEGEDFADCVRDRMAAWEQRYLYAIA